MIGKQENLNFLGKSIFLTLLSRNYNYVLKKLYS